VRLMSLPYAALALVVFFGEFFLVFACAQGLYEVVDACAEGAEKVCDAAGSEYQEHHQDQEYLEKSDWH
jgi:hypothetical protein